MSKSERNAALGSLVAIVTLMIPLIMWSGVVSSWLWMWFVVPVFSVPVITWWQASGLVVFLIWLKIGTNKPEEVDIGDDFVDGFLNRAVGFVKGILLHAAALGIGYVVHMLG